MFHQVYDPHEPEFIFFVIFKNHVDEFSHPSFLCRIFVCQQKPEQSPCGEDG